MTEQTHQGWFYLTFMMWMVSCSPGQDTGEERSEILQWKDGKKAAVSLTYDDGSINQFRVALPMMEEMGFRGTFFINTGQIPGSEYQARFIGRPIEEIIAASAVIPADPDNLYERGAAVRFLGIPEGPQAHTRAGAAVDAGNLERACRIIDEAFDLAREATLPVGETMKQTSSEPYSGAEQITWDEIGEYAARGHEFASHTLSHPRLAIMDEPNMRWELEKCREEILQKLGPGHTFSCECPYGTENERVMKVALTLYPALRNRMPHDWLEELNRSSRSFPGASEKPYVQWQRGPLSHTSLDLMESWADTCLAHDNIWLVLVFHGVDGVGWEAIPGDTLHHFFSTLHAHDSDLWVAPFREVTKYMRERMNGQVDSDLKRNQIRVTLSHDLDPQLYDVPLSVRTRLPDRWKKVHVTQEGKVIPSKAGADTTGRFITYQALPNRGPVLIERDRS